MTHVTYLSLALSNWAFVQKRTAASCPATDSGVPTHKKLNQQAVTAALLHQTR